jgi:hypothetical protein
MRSINEYSVASDEESVSSSLKTPNSVCTSRNPSSDLDEHEFISTANEEKLAEEQKQWVKEGPQTAKSTNPKKYFWHGLKYHQRLEFYWRSFFVIRIEYRMRPWLHDFWQHETASADSTRRT